MNITILERDDDITLAVLTGRLDTTGVDAICESFSETLGTTQSTIIDLSQIEFIGSRGLGLLVAHRKKLIKTDHKLVLLSPTEIVESVLAATRLDQIMPVTHDLDEAIQKLGGVPGQSDTDLSRSQMDDEPGQQQSEPEGTAAVLSEGELKLEIENQISELEGLHAALSQFLREHGAPHKAAYAVNLAIDELVVNVIRYAYVDDDTHLINIELAIEGEQIILRIADDGRPFDPRKGPALDLHAADREVAGLGLLLVLEMVDVLKYRRIDEMNQVEVRVHVFAEDENSDPSSIPGGHSNVP